MSAVINIQGLSKRYHISAKDEFWALQDLNLELQAGEVLGLIGHNGAGKSTLLKILSRITAPSQGKIDVHGRIASLLEVGTGFHPDLSGRDNIYLNGSILGMKRKEIKARFDQIVEFAGVERFLDMPVKRYSSGMYVRLAFSVAAHLDSDILLIDEVLAVGDADFQKKCLQRMEDISGEQARSIIFVSHNLHAIHSLCDRVALLSGGQLKDLGEPAKVIQSYQDNLKQLQRDLPVADRKDRAGDGRAKLLDCKVSSAQAEQKMILSGSNLKLQLHIAINDERAKKLRVQLHLFNEAGNYLSSLEHEESIAGRNSIDLEAILSSIPLMAGDFFWNCHVFLDGVRADFLGRAQYFQVQEAEFKPNELANIRKQPGIYLEHNWSNI